MFGEEFSVSCFIHEFWIIINLICKQGPGTVIGCWSFPSSFRLRQLAKDCCGHDCWYSFGKKLEDNDDIEFLLSGHHHLGMTLFWTTSKAFCAWFVNL